MIEHLQLLNNNKLFWGITMVLMNIGSRYVVTDLGKIHERILTNELVKKVIIFSMFFVATRDILTAFMLTVSYTFVVDGLLHEKRKFCIVPRKFITSTSNSNTNNISGITNTHVGVKDNKNTISNEDYLRAKNIVDNYEKNVHLENNININLFDIYKKNLSLI